MKTTLAALLTAILLTLAGATTSASTWTVNANGDWSNSGNWSDGVPNGIGATAAFNPPGGIDANRTINLDIAPIVGSMTLDDATSAYRSWILSGANTLTFDAVDTGPATLTVNRGTANEITAPVALTDSLNASINNSSWLRIGGAVSGSGGIVRTGDGTGTLLLSSVNNSYSGGTTVNAGTLKGGSGANTGGNETVSALGVLGTGAVGVAAGAMLIADGPGALLSSATGNPHLAVTLQAGGKVEFRTVQATTVGGNFTVTGSGDATFQMGRSWGGSYALSINVGSLNIGSQRFVLGEGEHHHTGSVLTFTGNTTITNNATFNVDTATVRLGTVTQSGGNQSLTKTGSRTLIVHGLHEGGSNYAGGTFVNEGTLIAGSGTNVGNKLADAFGALGSGPVTVASGATLIGRGPGAFKSSAVGNPNLPITVHTGATIQAHDVPTVDIGGDFTIVGAGSVTFKPGREPGGNYGFSQTVGNLNIGDQTFNMRLAPSGVSTVSYGLNMGSVTLVGSPTFDVLNETTGTATLTLGAIGDGGAGHGIVKTNDGTLAISGVSTYGGPTIVSGGELRIVGGNDRLPTGTTLHVNTGATFQMNNFHQTVGGLMDGSAGGGTVTNGGANSRTFTIVTANAGDDFSFSGAIAGGADLSLVKDGLGTQRLTGASTYSGATTVTAGTLDIGGSLGTTAISVSNGATLLVTSPAALTNDITLAAGARLGGTGTVPGMTVPNGVILSPGASFGTLTFDGNLVLSETTILEFELGSPSGLNDLIHVTGDLTLDGILSVVARPGFVSPPATYTLFTYGGSLLADNGLLIPDLGVRRVSLDTSEIGLVNLVLIPEPASLTLLALAGLALLKRTRKP